ncbi:MAG: hypothetical protein Q8Q08_07065 [Candidatus Omnitrophota bacterium]|nr:hypothetical protein [Candidatus Omnitrophota bacterium]MDZ4242472.1 hypothetical protein [Candidatus Omnitrophota bacterium]
MNNSGKALTIFLFVIAILLISLTAISVFFFLQEVELRKAKETQLTALQDEKAKLEGEMKEAKKQVFLLQEKEKEFETKIDDLQQELELVEGVKEEIKKENKALTDALEAEKKIAQEAKNKLSAEIEKAKEEVGILKSRLDAAQARNQELEKSSDQLNDQINTLRQAAPDILPAAVLPDAGSPAESAGPEPARPEEGTLKPARLPKENVELEKIIVNPSEQNAGKVISVDAETGFIISSLGERDGIAAGAVLSVYRDNSYLGDVKVSRVLPEMSAADFIPPLTGQQVSKNDQVVIKQ